MQNIKKLAKELNSIDDTKRFNFTVISDKKHIIDDQFQYDDDLADYNAMLAKDHGDFSSINLEDE
jgi:hypothetical protein